MKEYIIAFAVAIVSTAWVLDTKSPPGAGKVGVLGVSEATKRKTIRERDETLGNFFMVDQPKLRTYETNVVDDSDLCCPRANFPLPGSPN
jgi:hypothetical protein